MFQKKGKLHALGSGLEREEVGPSYESEPVSTLGFSKHGKHTQI
jgi:hypothetical protein